MVTPPFLTPDSLINVTHWMQTDLTLYGEGLTCLVARSQPKFSSTYIVECLDGNAMKYIEWKLL